MNIGSASLFYQEFTKNHPFWHDRDDKVPQKFSLSGNVIIICTVVMLRWTGAEVIIENEIGLFAILCVRVAVYDK